MNTKTTLVLALVCVVVFAYLLLVEKPWQAEQVAEETTPERGQALFDPKPELKSIDRVKLTEDDGRAFVFVRRDDEGWDLAEPIQAKASKFEVDALVRTILDLSYVKEYGPDSEYRPSEATTGLDKPIAEVKLMDGDDLKAHVLVGSRVPTGKGNYLKLAGDDRIFVSKETLNRHFGKRLSDYRDKRVLDFRLADVQRVKVEGVRNFELVRENETDWLVESPYRGDADKTKAENVIRPLTFYGLDKPQLKVTVETERTIPAKASPGTPNTKPADTQPSVKKETFVLAIGAAADTKGERYFARLDGASSIFTIRQDTFNNLTPNVADLFSKKIASVVAAKVRQIELVNESGAMKLTKDSEGKWRFPDGAPADAALVSSLIKAVNDLTASEYIDPDKNLMVLDWDHPRAKVSLTQEGQLHPTTVLVGPSSASGQMVYVRNQASQAVAAVRAPTVAQFLEPPIAYRGRRILSFNAARARQIEIVRKGAAPVRLVRKDGRWMMTEPVSAPADADAVRYALQDLATLNAKRVVGVGDLDRYGLDDPGVSVAVTVISEPRRQKQVASRPATQPATATAPATTQAGEDRQTKLLKELIEYQKTNPQENPKATEILKQMLATREAPATQSAGPGSRPAPVATPPAEAAPKVTRYILNLSKQADKVYAAVAGRPMVFELDRRIYDDLTAEMHDCTLTHFTGPEVVEMAFVTGGKTMTLRKVGEEQWRYEEDPLVPIDSKKVKDLVIAFRGLRTHRFVDYDAEDVSAYGLGDSADRVRIVLKDGKKYEILLSAKGPAGDPDHSRYAMLAGTRKVFLLTGEQAAKFAQKLEDVEKKAD